MRTMQEKLTSQFRISIIAYGGGENSGLEVVDAPARAGGGHEGTWYVQRGLDTLLTIRYAFTDRKFTIVIGGPLAVRGVRHPDWCGANSTIETDYAKGRDIAKVLDILRVLLAPWKAERKAYEHGEPDLTGERTQ